MVACQLRARVLLPAVQAAVIIPAKQGAVAKWWAEALNDPALNGDDGLQVDAGLKAGESLDTAENRGKGIPDAPDDIAFGVR